MSTPPKMNVWQFLDRNSMEVMIVVIVLIGCLFSIGCEPV